MSSSLHKGQEFPTLQKRMWEFWAVDKNGDKYHEYIESKSGRKSKVKKIIEAKYKFNISECIDFGMRLNDDL